MNDGEIEQVDPPQQLYDSPQTRFVAEFIGSPSMNLAPVEITERNGGYRAVHEEFSIPLPHQPGLDTLGEGTGLLGIRPESFAMVDGATDDHSMELTVDLVESMGDTLVVHCHVGDDELQFVSYDAHREIERGDTLEMTYDPEQLHVFDPETGEAIYHSSHIENRSKPTEHGQVQSVGTL
jgi:multiple sugar transport system ATP-binding protein